MKRQFIARLEQMEHDENQVRARLNKLSHYDVNAVEQKEVKKKKSSKALLQTTPSVVQAGQIVQVLVSLIKVEIKTLKQGRHCCRRHH